MLVSSQLTLGPQCGSHWDTQLMSIYTRWAVLVFKKRPHYPSQDHLDRFRNEARAGRLTWAAC